MNALAVVLARGGSKGLPGKNLRPLAGRPLLAWTIDAGRGAERVGRVVVSSDDDAILEASAAAGAETLRRPADLARDDTPSEAALTHAWEEAARGEGVLVLLQPTSPLRDARDVDAALALLEDRAADAVISVTEPGWNPWKCFHVGDDGFLHGIVDDDAPFRPRQSLPRALAPNGAIYGVRATAFERTGRLFQPRTIPYEMPAERSLDIDDEDDLERAAAAIRAGTRTGG